MVKANDAFANAGRRTRQILAMLIVLMAFALRCWELDHRSLWFDEGMEYWVATAAPVALLSSVRQGIQDPPLYSFLLHGWMRIGHEEFVVRYLSVLVSTLSVVGVMVVGGRTGGSRAGLVAGGLLALLPAEIRYAQEAGQYALMVCLLTWVAVAWHTAIQDRRKRVWCWWLLAGVTATYCYYGAFFAIVAPLAVFLGLSLWQRRWHEAQTTLFMASLYGLCLAPLAFFFLPQQLFRGPTANAGQPVLASPLLELQNFWQPTHALLAFQFIGWPWSWLPAWLPVGCLLLALAAALWLARSQSQVRLLLLNLVATTALLYLASRFNLFPYGFRYGLVLTPFLLPAIGAGIAAVWVHGESKRFLAWVGALILIGLLVSEALSLPHTALRKRFFPASTPDGWPEQEDVRPLAIDWLAQRRPGQITYVYYGAAPSFRYYIRLLGAEGGQPSPTWYLDCWRASPSAECVIEQVYYGRSLRNFDPADKLGAVIEQLPPDFAEAWFVFSHVVEDEERLLMQAMTDEFEIVEQRETTGASLYRLRRR